MKIWVILTAFLLTQNPFTAYAESVPVDLLLNPTVFSDKLTQQSVWHTFQDSHGALWFLTQEGLNRYIGHELENYTHVPSNPSSLPANTVTGITEDQNGAIWISTLGGGLAKYNSTSNSFEAISADPNNKDTPYSNEIHSVYTDSRGTIWLGYKNGFSTFSPIEQSFHHFISGNSDLPYMGEIYGFTETGDGKIWATTHTEGLLEIDPAQGYIRSHSHNPDDPNSIVPGRLYRLITDNDNNIWIASENSGVSKFDPNTGDSVNFTHSPNDIQSLSSNKTTDVFQDAHGDIWVATAEGINLFNSTTGKFHRYSTHNTNITDDWTLSIYQTKEDMYWVGTRSGLASGSRAQFKKYNRATHNLSGQSVNAFAETDDGSFWVGTDDGLNRLRPNKEYFEWVNESTEPSISSSIVMSLYHDNGILWIGTFDGGLNKLDLDSNEVTVFRHNPLDKNSIGSDGITSILRVSSGKLLIGTYGGGLSLYNEESNTFTNLTSNRADSNTISNDMVLAIYQDSDGTIWIGTENGLNLFLPKSHDFRRFISKQDTSNSLPSNIILTFQEDRQGTLWIGTSGGGLAKWNRKNRSQLEPNFTRISELVPFPSASIYGIQQDRDGWLWLSHNRGLTRLDPQTLEAHQYGVKDGLQAPEFNLGASFKSSSNVLYFGGIAGFNAIDPDRVTFQRVPPKVAISEIKIMNQRRQFDTAYHNLNTISLGYEDRMLSVEFFAADYSNPDQLNYAYMLEGINPDWVISPDSRTASFTTLPPGNYNLKLAAASPDGTWNWDARSIPIVVAPPPWRSLPAYALYAVFAISLVAYYFYRQRRKAQASLEIQRELESRVKERTQDLVEARKVAEEATRAKSDFLATMSHEIRTPMHGIIGMTELLLHTNLSGQQRQFATAAHNSGESLLSLINEILDFSKAEASKVELEEVEFNIVELIDDICYLQGEPASRKGLDLNNICDPDSPEILIGDPTKIRQVVMNLVSNSIKFTQHGNVNVRVKSKFSQATPDKAIVHICVEDDGIGMDTATQEKVFEPFTQADTSTTREYGGTGLGLSISRHYITLMGGDISVQSEQAKGTKITIMIPLIVSSANTQRSVGFDSLVARVFSTNTATFEMIENHLKRLGITTARITEQDLSKSLDYNNDVVLIDYRKGELEPRTLQLLPELKAALCVALTPLDGKLPAEFAKEWSRLTKPITNKALQDVFSKPSGFQIQHSSNTSDAKGPPSKGSACRILVAEDVETNQRIIEEMLHLLGYEVDIANNGQDAVDQYKSGGHALLFMDCQMPILDGYQATREIRAHEHENGLPPTPIIALTAGSDDEDKERCKKAGMNDYIKKPFSISDIKLHIASILPPIDLSAEDNRPTWGTDEANRQNADPIITAQDGNNTSDIFNLSAINSIREVENQTGRPLLPALFDGYKNQMVEKLTELEQNYEKQDCEALYRTAHAIKSMSANIGAEQIRIISAELEQRGRHGSMEEMDTNLKDLRIAYNEFLKEFSVIYVDS
ncbi:MAG: two-component regulator propeller domain-containing protein [Halioglobus sp.]|nr:two-component regulator propeller domain-containing protein [Halioglobus sp.]